MSKKYNSVLGLLGEEERWTRGCAARDDGGVPSAIMSDRSTCWCLMGALNLIYNKGQFMSTMTNDKAYIALSDAIIEYAGKDMSVVAFNDKYEHSDIIKVLERAGI